MGGGMKEGAVPGAMWKERASRYENESCRSRRRGGKKKGSGKKTSPDRGIAPPTKRGGDVGQERVGDELAEPALIKERERGTVPIWGGGEGERRLRWGKVKTIRRREKKGGGGGGGERTI